MIRRSAKLAAIASVALASLLLSACGDAPPAPPKTPSAPVLPPGAQAQGQPLIGMSDTPSSVRPNEASNLPARPQMNGQALGYYQQALSAFANGDLGAARNLFQQATQADPRAHQAFYSLGVVQERLRDSGAGASYRQAYTIVPDYEPAIIAGAMLQARKGNLGDADRLLSEKRGQMPKSAAVAATLAEIKSLEKDTGAAQRIAQEALKLNPDYRPAMVIIARDHFRNRRLDLALYALQAVLDGFGPDNPPRDKDNPEAHLLRGLIWREQGNRAGAMDEFRKALAIRPDMVEARVQFGTFLLEAGSPEEALPILEGAKRFDSENVPARLELGDAYRLLAKYDLAKSEFDWVASKDSSLPQVHYDLGLLYLFAPAVPGMTPKQQVAEAMKELTKFQQVRNKAESDDSDELLNRAKLKEGDLNAGAAPAPPAVMPSAAPAAGSAAPAAGSAAPAAGSAAPTAAGSAHPATH